ncbi:MAG: hypothetical protein M3Q82_11250, partial [Actinomycetota bacterium]|nr:hypothetical protein [Actinomycetota bacterium]
MTAAIGWRQLPLDCTPESADVRRTTHAATCTHPDRRQPDDYMATTNDLKNGMVLNLDGQLWSVVWFQ